MSEGGYLIRRLQVSEVEAFVAHSQAHDAESEREGDLPHRPYDPEEVRPAAEIRARAIERWNTPLTSPHWRRAWGLWHQERVVGHVSLTGGALNASKHRAQLGVGIQRSHRRRGWGRQLVETAIAWAAATPSLDWIDLGVFEGNVVALALYRRPGFRTSGYTADLFRVSGHRINAIHMTRWVGDANRLPEFRHFDQLEF